MTTCFVRRTIAAAAAVLLLGAAGVSAQRGYGPGPGGARHSYALNDGWSYLERNLRDPAGLEAVPPGAWVRVELPHTWNAFDVVDPSPGYRRYASWYRRELAVGDTAGVRYLLHFDGANITTDVYVNGRRAGGHVGGYVGFDVDLTPWLSPRATNRLDVRVDNSYDPRVIPSQKSDFAIDGGITRDVFLDVVPSTRIAAVRVRTPAVSRARAEAVLSVEVTAPAGAPDYTLDAALTGPGGDVVARSGPVPVRPAADGAVEIPLPPVKAPRLWSPSLPALYTATVRLLRGGKPIDALGARFGFRWYEFRPGGPFFLNGERLVIRGTQWHEDYAGFGAALPDSLRVRDMAAIKAMGANFVRLAHYPQDPAVYAAADSLGLLVWDELPWCRGGVGDSEWQANTRRLLTEQIHQNMNHPSIILWSLGNEVDWVPDFPGGGDTTTVNRFLRTLNDDAHALDPGRPTALRKYAGAIPIVDVFSPSIWSGWYSGVYKDYEKALEATRRIAPRFVHMEWGGDSHVGRHTENPITGDGLAAAGAWEESANQVRVRNIAQNGDWSESYIVELMDWYLTTTERLDWFTGSAQWIFKDFPTPLRPENPIPYVNQKGLLTRDGLPKDAYYVFKAHWAPASRPFAYIESHSWLERRGKAGQSRAVRVWSNCAAVELFLDGVAQGVKRRVPQDFPAMGLRWTVAFREGDNHLRASCVSAGGAGPGKAAPVLAGDTLTVRYTTVPSGAPDHFRLSSRPLPDGHVLIEAVAVDSEGRPCLDYQKRVYFSHDGAGQLLADYGTPTRSRVIEMANGRAAIEFVPGVGRAVVEVRNQDLKGDFLELGEGRILQGTSARSALPADPQPRPLRSRLDTLALAALDTAAARYLRVATRLDPAAGHPRYAEASGAWRTSRIGEWTSGFFPGTLWSLYELSDDPGMRVQAERWTTPLAAIFRTRYSHDLGFQFFTTNAHAYALTGEGRFRATALEAARLLSGRFNARVGAIRSWDWMAPARPFPVIADNMMNLELLYWGARHGGSKDWADEATRHAFTTLENHVRADGGSFHVVAFDTATGRAVERFTHQGFADGSTWSRGEAWLLYGFTMAYRESGNPRFLSAARRLAAYYLAHLPPDAVPCWDFQAPGCPGGPELRDAAAAAVGASALLELSQRVRGAAGQAYRAAAERTLLALSSPPYFAPAGADALLLHATGNRPGRTEVDVSLVYADYYYVETLLRYAELRGLLPAGSRARDWTGARLGGERRPPAR